MSYTSEHDYNTADTGGGSFDLIPADTVAHVRMTIRPGSVGDGGWLTQSQSSDAQYLNCEFIILEGPHAKRKFWGNLTVLGGKVNEKNESIAGNITRATLRAILESARNVRPDDESDDAKRKRLVNGYGDFNGAEFWTRIGVEPARDQYAAKNKLGAVVTPDKPEYGQESGTPQAPTAAPSWQPNSPAKTQDQNVAPAWAR